LLRGRRVITGSESDHVQRVLRAAANTYLAAVGVRLAAFIFWFVLVAAAANIGRGRIL
jgi:Zn-dependent membrane protease YugP